MPARPIDRSKKRYEGRADLKEPRLIEDPRVREVAASDPPLKSVQPEFYHPDPQLLQAVNLAKTLGRPLLLQGDPGCGKTRLAYAVAFELELPLEECYIKSTTKAQDLLYTYDAVNRLYDAQLGEKGPKDADGEPLSKDPRHYILLGPLGRAIQRAGFERRSVVLIDEIDKADLDFPNDLLLELDRLWFQVNEVEDLRYAVPDDRPDLRPIVIITHNEEKALPAAFLRRCIYHYVRMPEKPQALHDILALKDFSDQDFNLKAIEVLQRLRKLDLNKKPGLSELLDWVGYLKYLEMSPEAFLKLPAIGALLKDQSDQRLGRVEFGLPPVDDEGGAD